MSNTSAAQWSDIEDALHDVVAATSGVPGTSVIWAQQADARPTNPWISLLLGDLTREGAGWVDSVPNPLVFSDTPFTANATTDQLTATAHGRTTGDGPVRFTTTGTLPAGLALATDYWLVVVDTDHLKVSATFPDSVAVSPTTIDLTGAGSGSHTMVDTDDTVAAGAELLSVVRATYSATLTIQCYTDAPTGADPGSAPLSAVAMLHAVAVGSLLPSVRALLSAAGVGSYDFGQVRAVGAPVNSVMFEPRAVLEAKLWLVAQVSETAARLDAVGVVLSTDDVEGNPRPDVDFDVPSD